jgi:uncharacterized repeat protein (TIGR01451 family)
MSLRIPLLAAALCLLGAAPALANTSDLAVTNSGSPDPVAAGQYVSYGIGVTNNGPDSASGVTVTDPLPPRTQYVPGDSRCSLSGSTVSCDGGTLPSGGNEVFEIVLRLTDFSQHVPIHNTVSVTSASTDPNLSDNSATFTSHVFNTSHDHHITVSKAEQEVDFNAGQTQTVQLACPDPSDIMLDGSLEVLHVDQDTGTLRDVVVTESKAVGDGYEFTATNFATGRAQTKAFGTCISKTTQGGGSPSHTHDVVVEAPQTVTIPVTAGNHYNVKVPCNSPDFVTAASPGFEWGGGAQGELTYSVAGYDSGGAPAWDFGFDATISGTVTASIRCLHRYVTTVLGHTHELWLSHVDQTFVVHPNAPAGDVYNLDCSDEAKGIVAGFDLPFGVHSMGNDPQPKRRSFHLLNDTGSDLTVHLYLLCVGDRTGTDPPPPKGPAAVRTVATPSPSGATVPVGVTCPAGGCSGTVTLLAPGGGSRAVAASARVIGSATFLRRARGHVDARVSIAKAYRGAIRSGRLRSLTAVVRKIDGKIVKRFRLRLRR